MFFHEGIVGQEVVEGLAGHGKVPDHPFLLHLMEIDCRSPCCRQEAQTQTCASGPPLCSWSWLSGWSQRSPWICLCHKVLPRTLLIVGSSCQRSNVIFELDAVSISNFVKFRFQCMTLKIKRVFEKINKILSQKQAKWAMNLITKKDHKQMQNLLHEKKVNFL